MEALLFPIVLIIILVESIMSGRWKRFYFEHGLKLFTENLTLYEPGLEVSAIVDKMNKKFKGSGFGPSIYFKDLNNGNIAFREKMFEFALFTYTPIMHGRISLNLKSQKIHIVGLANWFPLAFCCLWYISLLPNISFERDFMFLLAPIIIVGFIYIIQRNKYHKVFNHLAEIIGKNNPI